MPLDSVYGNVSSAAAGMNPVSSDENSTPEELQFVRAEPVKPEETAQCCVGCKSPIVGTYFHANGKVGLPELCGTGSEKPASSPASSLGRAALYGRRRLRGFAIYTIVAITTGFQIGLIAILVGYMVGRAGRGGARGLGGRPQQILAVALTHYSITHQLHSGHSVLRISPAGGGAAGRQIRGAEANSRSGSGRRSGVSHQVCAVFYLLLVYGSGALPLPDCRRIRYSNSVIIFFGLSRAWRA